MNAARKIVNDRLWSYADKIEKCDIEIRMCNILINDLANPLKAADINGMPKTNTATSSTEKAVLLRETYCDRIVNETQKKAQALAEFEEYISPLGRNLQNILRDRFINKKSLPEIARNQNYSISAIRKKMQKAQDILYIKSL